MYGCMYISYLSYECEKYLTAISNVKLRVALTKFRISAHDLEIERVRYPYTTRENRTCKLCNCHVET